MRCECDLQLARKLAQHEDEWNVNHHRRWGDNPFNAAESCRAQHATTADSSEALTAQPQHQPVNDDGSVTVSTRMISRNANLIKNDKFDDPDLGYVTVPELTTSSPPYFADYDTQQPQNKTLSDGARPNVADYSAEGACFTLFIICVTNKFIWINTQQSDDGAQSKPTSWQNCGLLWTCAKRTLLSRGATVLPKWEDS